MRGRGDNQEPAVNVFKLHSELYFRGTLRRHALMLSFYTSYLLVSVKHLILEDHLPADLRPVVHDDIHVCPSAKLSLPVGDGG